VAGGARANENGRALFYVQSVGEMRMCFHRALPPGAVLKHVVLKNVNGRWYACIMLELPQAQPEHSTACPELVEGTGKAVGIDVGLKSLATLSSGEYIENPRHLRGSLAKLRRLQRAASRQVKGSHRQRKSYARVARLSEQIACQRADYLHKLSRRLVVEHDLIAIENLNLGFMNHNRHLALSSHDAGFGLLRQMLAYKAEEAGIAIITVNPANTTQACSRCGKIVPKDLSVRVHECPDCGLVLDRDVNAARNILSLALNPLGRLAKPYRDPLGRSGQDETWAAAPSVS
jgi:putative transposase